MTTKWLTKSNPKISGSGYLKIFKHKVRISKHGVCGSYIDWCEDNCKSKQGWHFEDTEAKYDDWEPNVHWNNCQAVLTFVSKKEAFMFALHNMKHSGE